MGTKRLTDITSVTGITLSDLIHIVVTGDTSQNAAGSSYKASLQQVYNAFNIPTSFTFTGNTSASCITDLYVTNLYGCSPITVNDTLTITNGNVIKSNGGGELNLNYLNDPSTVILSTDNGNFSEQAQIYLGPFNRGPGGYIELSTYFSAGTTYIAGGYDISNKVLGDIILGDMSGYPGYSTGSGVKIRRMADFLTGVPSEIIELYNNGILVSGLTVDIGESVRINKAYTLPIADGSNGYVLTTDGSGNTTWQASGFQYEIGEHVPSEGGIIFHRWKSNTSLGVPTNGSFENYMVVTTGDTSTSAEYGFENINTSADSSWDGSGNTQTLVSFSGSGTYAAYLCTQVNNGGKTDWYLPSINELVRLMSNRLELEQTLSFIGGDTLTPTTVTGYWSSTEANVFPYNSAFYYLTDQGISADVPKSTTIRVRAIRKFSI